MNRLSSNPVFAKNVILIGMPGSGKSTVGVLLAKRLAWGFTDTDVLIQARLDAPLRLIQERLGMVAFRRLEDQCLRDLKVNRQVIATGGSAIYYPESMAHLQSQGVVVFLDVPFAELKQRLANFEDRGLVRTPGQSLQSLWRERRPLYQQYAQVTVPWRGEGHESMADKIISVIGRTWLDTSSASMKMESCGTS
jgi:shikimate kinase